MKIDKVLAKALEMPIDENSKIVIMSDQHRGAGGNADNFTKNQNIFEAALRKYYLNGFTYIELGDGDDMWEVTNYDEIIKEHLKTFKLLKKFHDDKRFFMIYGNHDMCKKNKEVLKKFFYFYQDVEQRKQKPLLNELQVHESILLKYYQYDLLVLHGHQVDFLNSSLWRLSRFLVRYLWKPLETIGLKDPTSAAKNYKGGKLTEKKLAAWSKKKNKILIAGHTHRPVYPNVGENLYFNDGTCIHPDGITCIEIENGKITLVKWALELKGDNILAVGREVIAGGDSILSFYQKVLKR